MTRPNRFLFDEAIAAFRERNGHVIVEIGGIRNRGWRDTDGHSTLRWPVDATVWSVDTDPAAVKLTRELAADRPNVFCVLADALAFLRAFPIRIDRRLAATAERRARQRGGDRSVPQVGRL